MGVHHLFEGGTVLGEKVDIPTRIETRFLRKNMHLSCDEQRRMWCPHTTQRGFSEPRIRPLRPDGRRKDWKSILFPLHKQPKLAGNDPVRQRPPLVETCRRIGQQKRRVVLRPSALLRCRLTCVAGVVDAPLGWVQTVVHRCTTSLLTRAYFRRKKAVLRNQKARTRQIHRAQMRKRNLSDRVILFVRCPPVRFQPPCCVSGGSARTSLEHMGAPEYTTVPEHIKFCPYIPQHTRNENSAEETFCSQPAVSGQSSTKTTPPAFTLAARLYNWIRT